MRRYSWPKMLTLAALTAACRDEVPRAPDAPPPIADVADVAADAPWTCARTRATAPTAPTTCNGATAYCDRRFDQMSWVTTHNAMSSEHDRFASPNQRYGLTRQLSDGVRGLMLDAYVWRDGLWLCHGTCLAGARRLVEGLCEVGQFLDRQPDAVVTLIFESYVSARQMESAFREVGLTDDVHTQVDGAPWPTLRAMIAANRRLVVLTDREGGQPPWHHDVWRHAQENPFAARTPADLSCRMNRGRAGNALFIVNHFLSNPLPSPELAETVNHDPTLADHITRCRRERMRLLNFVTVDFYDIGDVFSVVRGLNDAAPDGG